MNELQVDQGHRVLNDLIQAFGKLSFADANEAETGFKVIDGVLEKVLGWQKDDIAIEPPCSENGHTDYADYLVKTATTSIIVEAKRAGAAFTLPNNLKAGKLGGFLSSGAVGEAISQVKFYCHRKSAQFAVVTNGDAWIVFPAVRVDGVEFADTQARIFRSLEDINKRFVEFWELLSRQRVIEGNLERELLQVRTQAPTRRALSLLQDPNVRIARNTLFSHLSVAVDKVLTDEGLANDSEAMSFCYVRNAERTGFDARLRMYLSDPKPQLGIPSTRVRTSKKSYDILDQRVKASIPTQSKFFLILGQVGAGKSTFLSYTRIVSASSFIDANVVWLYVDFRKATEQDIPREFIYSRLLDLIERDKVFNLGDWSTSINPAYSEEIDNLSRGPLFLLRKTDPGEFDKEIAKLIMTERSLVVPYVDRILLHASKARSLFIVIDNVDQIEDDKRQSEIFAESQALSQKHKISIILSLRDTTFRKYRSSPTFNAFEVEAMYIDPPSVVPVLARRFTYARKLLAGKKADLLLESGAHFKADDIGAFFEIAAQSLLSTEGSELIETLSGGDIRRGLSLAKEFLASGHITADLALQKYLTDQAWRFPSHEVFKGCILGGRKFYREEDSLLPNMYCAKLGVPALQLLRLVISAALVQRAQTAAFEGAIVEELQATLHQVGVAQGEVDTVLKALVQSAIVRTVDGAPLCQQSRLFPTRLAGYLVHDLMGRFDYVEMCLLDAHIYDDELWATIQILTRKIQLEGSPVSRLRTRIERVKAFVSHLETIEERWIIEAKRRNLGESWLQDTLCGRLRPLLDTDCERALHSAQRHR